MNPGKRFSHNRNNSNWNSSNNGGSNYRDHLNNNNHHGDDIREFFSQNIFWLLCVINILITIAIGFWYPNKWLLLLQIPILFETINKMPSIFTALIGVLALFVMPIHEWYNHSFKSSIPIGLWILIPLLIGTISSKTFRVMYIISFNAMVWFFAEKDFIWTLFLSLPLIINVLEGDDKY